jgi:uncharacterized protein YyaL (SSP411 family)
MEHESFENETIAAMLNQNFVCIKVDREEHPDVDSIYMNSVQLMTGRGGWPLNVFLDASLKPFYGGTYFRPAAFLHLLQRIHEAWTQERSTLEAQGEHLFQHLQKLGADAARPAGAPLPIENYFDLFTQHYDPIHGGKAGAPKFPLSYDLVLLSKLDSPEARRMLRQTIAKMSRGGTYDHLEGGLHRYSTDDEWKVPHFEKMLYDQSAFVEAALADYRASGAKESLFIARRTLDYVLDRLQTPQGAFYSAEDADSEGHEGKFYRWSENEVISVLGEVRARALIADLDWPAGGNFEGHYVLHLITPVDLDLWHERHGEDLRRLALYRSQRVRPITDTKVLTSWNGLLLGALAKYLQVSADPTPKYHEALERGVSFLRQHLYNSKTGELYRRWADGEAKYRGTQADYAALVSGLIAVFALRPSDELAEWIEMLLTKQEELFSSPEQGLYWSTPADEAHLIIREIETYDNVEPSANSLALRNLSQWYALSGKEKYRERLERMKKSLPETLESRTHGFPALLDALLEDERGLSTEIVVSRDAQLSAQVSAQLLKRDTSSKLIIQVPREGASIQKIPWLKEKITHTGDFARYRCRNQSCAAPVTDPAALDE